MGDVFTSLQVRGLDGDGNFIGETTVKALVDTGAGVTVVSRNVAARAGIHTMSIAGEVWGVGGSVRVAQGLAMLDAPTCKPKAILVGISNAVTQRAGVEAIVGHDYMQRANMLVRPRARSCGCPTSTPRKPRKPPTPGEARATDPRGRR